METKTLVSRETNSTYTVGNQRTPCQVMAIGMSSNRQIELWVSGEDTHGSGAPWVESHHLGLIRGNIKKDQIKNIFLNVLTKESEPVTLESSQLPTT